MPKEAEISPTIQNGSRCLTEQGLLTALVIAAEMPVFLAKMHIWLPESFVIFFVLLRALAAIKFEFMSNFTNKPTDIIVLRNKIKHIGSHSGYDQVFNFLEKNNEFNITSSWRREYNAVENFLNLATLYPVRWFSGNRFFTLNHLRANIAAEKLALTKNAAIVHFSHWEDCYSSPFIFLKHNKTTKIIATAHQPVSFWKKNVRNTKHMARLDALIVLSNAEKSFFESVIPGKVHLIEHGADTSFFTPAPGAVDKNMKSCVFSGNWLRDLQMLVNIVNIVTAKRTDIRFNIINPHFENKKHPLHVLKGNPNVSFYKNLSDEELRDVYRKSAILVLPLKDSTANNGLMESAACGLPAVITDVGGVRDYTNGSFCEYVPLHSPADIFSNKIIEFLDDPAALAIKGQIAASFMREKFNWQLIADKTVALYNQTLNS